MHEYAVLHQIEREAEFARRKAYWEASERTADRRAGLVAAMILNSVRADKEAKVWEAADFFPSLRLNADGTPIEKKPEEMDTAETVNYLKKGFGLMVPTAFRQRVGLPD